MHTLRSLSKLVACDTETTGLNVWKGDRPYGFSFFDHKGRKVWLRGKVDPCTRKITVPDKMVARLKRFFSDPAITKVFYNAKFDIRMLNSIGVQVRGRVHEAQFAMHTLKTDELVYRLKSLAEKYLDMPPDEQRVLKLATMAARRKAKAQGLPIAKDWEADMWMADPPELLTKYAIGDAERTMLLWLFARDQMKEEGIYQTYKEEMQLWPVTWEMEQRGVCINLDVVREEIDKHEGKVKDLAIQIQNEAPGLNPSSPKQRQHWLFDTLGLPVQNLTKTGQPSTDGSTLRKLQRLHKLPALLVAHTAHTDALTKFFYKYLELAAPDPLNPGGYCLHTDFTQCFTKTGRYSSRNPNLHNAADPEGTRGLAVIDARKPFQPRPGYVWLHFDYKQIEVRIFAVLAQEEFMLDAINKGRDLHTEVSNKIWGGKGNPLAIEAARRALGFEGDWSDLNKKQRKVLKKYSVTDEANYIAVYDSGEIPIMCKDWLKKFDFDIVKAEASVGHANTRVAAKSLFFLKLFGGGVVAAAEWIGCNEELAGKYHQDFDDTFPEIPKYIRRCSNKASRQGAIWDLWGRRRNVNPDFGYKGVNYTVQGSAATLLKKRTRALWKAIKKDPVWCTTVFPVLTVHDELVLEVHKRVATKNNVRRIMAIMENNEGKIAVNTPVDVEIVTKSWNRKRKVQL